MQKAALTPDEISKVIYEAIAAEFKSIPTKTEMVYHEAVAAGVGKGISGLTIQTGYNASSMISKINTVAREWAKKRAAEMVGMKIVDGTLVENPNAKYSITETTRKDIRRIVKESFEDETPLETVISNIQDATAFSDQRAEMIARTEISFAQSHGNYETWKQTGVVTKVQWLLSADHEEPCVCNDNENEIVDIGSVFPSGDFAPPAHPHCWCVVVAVEFKDDEDA